MGLKKDMSVRIPDTDGPVRALKRISFHDTLRIIALALLVIVLWCNVYGMTRSTWDVPRVYTDDAWWTLAVIKAFRDDVAAPFLFVNVHQLNAPFSANWNDYPSNESMLPYSVSILAHVVGLMPAFNIAGLIAVILAAVAFYAACRMLDYYWPFAFVGAVVFAFSYDMPARLLNHLNLSYYWHIPLYLIVTWWCFDTKPLPYRSSRWWFAIAVAIVTGLQAIYYAFLFWQFLGFAILVQLLRRNRPKLLSVLTVTACSIGSTVLMALPYFLYKILHGTNASVVQRSLANLQVYALQLPELFLPPAHRWKMFADFAQSHFYAVTAIGGQVEHCYLGLIGIAGFVWLMGSGVVYLLQGRAGKLSVMFWESLWVVSFSILGGINLVLGVFGLQLFRATHRYAIVLLCLGLFFLIDKLGRILPKNAHLPVALLLLIVGVWDSVPPGMDPGVISQTQKITTSDQDFVRRLEQRFPSGAMAFELPVIDFPETPPKVGMADTEWFRPYFYSRNLRFSFGSDKGRPRESWQHDLESLPAEQMIAALERYGFGILLIDRKGYSDGAAGLLKDIASSGRNVIETDQVGDFVAVGLSPSTHPVLPDPPPFPGQGFYGWEGNWRTGAHTWSEGNAVLTLTNNSDKPIDKQYVFSLETLSKRTVTILTPNETKIVELNPGIPTRVSPLTIPLRPGETSIRFETDAPPVPAGGTDKRMVAFAVAILPPPPQEAEPILRSGFYGWEGDWHNEGHSWSNGSASLVFINSSSAVLHDRYSFLLNATSKRRVTVTTPAESKTVELEAGHQVDVGPFDLHFAPGETTIRFDTDRPPVPAGNGDPRKISFSVAIVHNTSRSFIQ